MGSYSIGEAISLLLEKSKWKPKVTELRMQQEWEEIVGKTISKYTRNISLRGEVLTIYSDVAALKQELHFGKQQLIVRINEYFKERVVGEIIVK
jgi:predicted nucleic acid-binding Zn ribbon protein